MVTKKHLKIFLSFLSLALLLLSCKARNKLGSETQGSQTINGDNGSSGGLTTNFSIPEEYWGEYVIFKGAYAHFTFATVSSNYVKYSDTYYISNYMGKNTWYCGNQHGHSNIYNQFFLNDKGQRVFYDILQAPFVIQDRQYTNIFIHREDYNKQ